MQKNVTWANMAVLEVASLAQSAISCYKWPHPILNLGLGFPLPQSLLVKGEKQTLAKDHVGWQPPFLGLRKPQHSLQVFKTAISIREYSREAS
jgi:hypothetical protein